MPTSLSLAQVRLRSYVVHIFGTRIRFAGHFIALCITDSDNNSRVRIIKLLKGFIFIAQARFLPTPRTRSDRRPPQKQKVQTSHISVVEGWWCVGRMTGLSRSTDTATLRKCLGYYKLYLLLLDKIETEFVGALRGDWHQMIIRPGLKVSGVVVCISYYFLSSSSYLISFISSSHNNILLYLSSSSFFFL